MKRKRIGAFDAPADPVAEPITCPSCDYRFDRDDEAAKSDRPDDVDDLVQCPKCKLQFVAPSSDDDDEGAPSREEEARVAAIAARYGMPLTAVRQAAREVARATIPTMAQQAQQTAARRSSR